MIILGIDPGTNCGWALVTVGPDGSDVLNSGVWDLKPGRHEGGGMRFLRLRTYLRQAFKAGLDAIAYEEVRSHAGTDAAHVYGGVLGVLHSEAEDKSIPYRGIPVGTVKKRATGKGNANKEMMVDAARGFKPSLESHDEADAIWCAVVLGEELG